MKKLIFAITCLFPLAGMAQKGYTITGNLPQLNVAAKAYLVTLKGRKFEETDSAIVKNGKFIFTGNVTEPQRAILVIKRSSPRQADQQGFYLENSKITFTGTDSIKNAVVKGSVSDREDRELSAQVRPFTDKILKIQNEFAGDHGPVAGKSAAERKAASDSMKSYIAAIKNIKYKFVDSHPDSFMGLYEFNTFVLGNHFSPAEVKPMFYKFSALLQSSSLGQESLDRILAVEKRGLGAKIIEFTQTDIEGKPFRIASLRGKYVLIDFWASWCYWCRQENPNVLKAYEQLKDKNLEIVSVSFDENKGAWENAVKQDKLPWLQVSDLKGMLEKDGLASMLDIKSIPQNLLINPEGIIIAANLRGADLTQKLSALIK